MQNTIQQIDANRQSVIGFFPELENHFSTVYAVPMPAYKADKSDAIRAMYRMKLDDGSELVVELSFVTCNLSDRNEIMNLWKRAGLIKEALPCYWAISTYHTFKDLDGFDRCVERFNPQMTKDGKIDFDWIIPASPKNRELILSEIEKRAKAGC